jgi:hypothetical protein
MFQQSSLKNFRSVTFKLQTAEIISIAELLLKSNISLNLGSCSSAFLQLRSCNCRHTKVARAHVCILQAPPPHPFAQDGGPYQSHIQYHISELHHVGHLSLRILHRYVPILKTKKLPVVGEVGHDPNGVPKLHGTVQTSQGPRNTCPLR